MEADWEEIGLIAHPPPGVNALSTPVTAIAFDTAQELLWTGNQFGRVMSFHGAELQRYCSYKGHSSETVKQVLLHPKGVISMSPRSLHFASRRGLTVWHLTHPEFLDLRCMTFTTNDASQLLVAGAPDCLFLVDVDKGVVSRTISSEAQYNMMKRGKPYVCAATNRGSVHILDPTTLQIVKIWQAHLGLINDMDVQAEYLVTCGWSPRQQHGLMLDPLANVLNLKSLTPLPPIPFQPGAAFVRMHPRMFSTCILASQTGQLQVIDLHNPNTVNLKQISIYEGMYLTAMELAPSGEALVLTDSLSQIHLWGSRAKLRFTDYSSPTVYATDTVPRSNLDWAGKTPLNTVGMPYYRETLLSAWPSGMVFEVGAPPVKPDPELTKKLKRAEMGFWAPNPRTHRRNQVENKRRKEEQEKGIVVPKFLSEKARDNGTAAGEDRRMSTDLLDSLGGLLPQDTTKKNVPLMYRNVEIKYSKFGVDDFDFEYYNKTPFSGLETHIMNSYANPLLQLYRFTPIIRNLALRHTSTSCLFETCLLCELGFLIDMLEKAGGRNCQATNFLRTFSKLPSASSLNILEENSSKTSLTTRIQTANRFLLDTFASDFKRQSFPQNRMLDQLLAMNATATIRCAVCNQEQVRPENPYVLELVYPSKNGQHASRASRPTFSQILKQSVEKQDVRGWCSRCNRYQALSSRKHISSVAAVLNINTAIQETDHKQLWCQPKWLPQEVGVIVQQGQLFCYEGNDLELHIQRGVYKVQVYELVGVVAEIKSSDNQQSHLVNMVNVGPSSRDEDVPSSWHLMNDFLVRQLTREDALRFDAHWKLPFVVTYQLKTASHDIDDSWKNNLDTSILYRMISAKQSEDLERFRLLNEAEAPGEGTHVGIDAEFISLQLEEIEIKADGKRETIRPSRMGLARVSVLRDYIPPPDGMIASDGASRNLSRQPSGYESGLPFIDDYIAVTEPIVDYLTAYSGIRPGDLDRNTSSHVLVGLKSAYKKLWLLLNLGVIFVGHGLLKDFRTINIHVPKRQVVDTVDLFYLPSRQRKIGLRFLSSLLLEEEIQTGMHDSVEDARTALKLYAYWKELQTFGPEEVERTLEWIYRMGYEMDWKTGANHGRVYGRPRTAGGDKDGPESRPATGINTPDVVASRSATSTPLRKGFKGGSAGAGLSPSKGMYSG